MQTQVQELVDFLGLELNPLQRQALESGLLEEPRVVISAPTASGKTLLGIMKILGHYQQTKKKALYIVPLRALASEKHEEFSRVFERFGLKIAKSTGDFDSSSEQLHAFDVIIVTSEKMDSLLRHKTAWLKDVGLVIVDEVHLLNDEGRGATLEVVLTKLKKLNAQVLALSATIPNSKELAEWMDAVLVQSDYRPTKLEIGVCDGKQLAFAEETRKMGKENFLPELVAGALKENNGNGQALFFVSTRRNAEGLAKELSSFTLTQVSQEEKEKLAVCSRKILGLSPTSQCRSLAFCVERGIAFHHAGLTEHQKSLVEKAFKKDRVLKVIVATTTLAMGIDYPASWVVVRDLKRYNGAFSSFITNLEVAQMVGRAGRPRYDKRGVGVLVCKPGEFREVREKYVFGELENIYSKLSSEVALRNHCLALVSSGYAGSFSELFDFFAKTFFAFQYKDTQELLELVERIVGGLKEMDFVREREGKLVATPIGKRVSELYVDPLSAFGFLNFMRRKRKSDFDFLLELQNATEARPLVSVKRNEEMELWNEFYALVDDLALANWERDSESLEKYKSAKLLNAWINEDTEDHVLESFQIPPGVLHARARNMEWLAYAMQELAFMLNDASSFKQAKAVRKRVKYGVKEELLDLCSIKSIGRVRARRLFSKGVKTREEFDKLETHEIKALIGVSLEN
ncbi:MAG: DEAD/DEAH box helicase [Candidatus Micrarchaeota archaeon]